MRSITLSAATLALLAASSAAGEEAGVATMRGTPRYAKAILDAAYAAPAWMADRCGRVKASLGDALGVVEGPIRVDARGSPLAGAWIEHVAVDGCGRARQLNVLAIVRRPGVIQAVALLPGTTRADPLLQKDATEFALRYAAIADPGTCGTSLVADTAYDGPQPGPPTVPGKPGWLERWTIEHCGKRIAVRMRFTPDAAGTSVNAGQAP